MLSRAGGNPFDCDQGKLLFPPIHTNKNSEYKYPEFLFAGLEGIEPPIAVLETAVIPFNYSPSGIKVIYYKLKR